MKKNLDQNNVKINIIKLILSNFYKGKLIFA